MTRVVILLGKESRRDSEIPPTSLLQEATHTEALLLRNDDSHRLRSDGPEFCFRVRQPLSGISATETLLGISSTGFPAAQTLLEYKLKG